MAITIEDVQTGSSPITKPTGLEVGDLMVAVVSGDSAGTALPAPSGWDTHVNDTSPVQLGIYSKIAESADVAASNFTFEDASSNALDGALYRVTDAVDNDTLAFETGVGDDNDGNATVAINPAETPVGASYLMFMGVVGFKSGANGNFSGYTMTGSPTFTERYDTPVSATESFAVADAPVNSLTEVTNLQATFSITTSTQCQIGYLMVYEAVSAAFTPAHLSVDAPVVQIPQMPTLEVTAPSVHAPAFTLPTAKWANADKTDAANIANTDKS